jgi:hypothetical protein
MSSTRGDNGETDRGDFDVGGNTSFNAPTDPSTVCVFPLPVCPYVKIVTSKPYA